MELKKTGNRRPTGEFIAKVISDQDKKSKRRMKNTRHNSITPKNDKQITINIPQYRRITCTYGNDYYF